MKIIIPGGSGQVGTILTRALRADGHRVVIFTRDPSEADSDSVQWDGKNAGEWTAELEGADAVINLAGRSVNCRYTAENKRLIFDSRVDSARAIGRAISEAKEPPPVWLQASTATIYAHTFGEPNDDVTGVIGGNEPDIPDAWHFSIDVATAWEKAVYEFDTGKTRKVLMRSAVTMSPDRGGIFDVMRGLVRNGLGGPSGDGRQFVSWVHETDLVNSVKFLIEHEELSGAVNIASPNPVPNAEFFRILRDAWGARFGLPASEWMLEIGAFLMRTETELVLKSRRVVPKRLTDAGFVFEFPEWKEAAEDLCRRWRESN